MSQPPSAAEPRIGGINRASVFGGTSEATTGHATTALVDTARLLAVARRTKGGQSVELGKWIAALPDRDIVIDGICRDRLAARQVERAERITSQLRQPQPLPP